MWLASEMAAFAQVVELGSFTAAARALGVPKVAVSRAVASLERQLGVRLLTRTTRRVALTPAGTLLQPHCERLLREVEAVRSRFEREHHGAQRLRVRVDPGYGRLLVSPLVPRFLERFPALELQVAVLEAPAVGTTLGTALEWDVLICEGEPDASALATTPLAHPPLLLWATPAYLQRHGRPRQPGDLARHAVLRARALPEARAALRLRRAGDTESVSAPSSLRVSDPALVHSCAAAGLGIAVLPEFLCRQGEARGRLERVLPGWSVEPALRLSALHAESGQSAVPIRLFLEFLLANLAPVVGTAA